MKTVFTLLIGAILIAGGGVLYWTKMQPTVTGDTTANIAATTTSIGQTPVTTTQTSPTPIATTTDESHPGMKLYRNDQWGFEFWYPKGWEWEANIFGSPFSKFNLTVMKIDGQYTSQNDFINVVTPAFADHADSNNGGEQNLKISKIYVDHILGTEQSFTFEGVPTIYIDVPLREFRMLFQVEAVHEKEFNQILSTFKFLN